MAKCQPAPGGSSSGLPKFLLFAGFLLLFLQMLSEVIKRIAVLAGLIRDPEPGAAHGHAASGTRCSGGHDE